MLLNKKQTANRIGVSYNTLREWVCLGKLPPPTERNGRMAYWDESVIDRYLKNNSAILSHTEPECKTVQ